MNGKKSPSRGTKKRKKLTARELRTNLIILGVILVASLTFFVVRMALTSPSPAVLTPAETVPQSVTALPEKLVPSPDDGTISLPVPIPPVPETVSPESSVAALAATSVDSSVSKAPAETANTSVQALSAPSGASATVASSVMSAPQKNASSKLPAAKSAPAAAPVVKAPSAKPPVPVTALSLAAPSGQKPVRPVPPKHRGTIVFVFDDAGHNLKQLDAFLSLPFPCTIAVLPGLQYSEEAARRIRAAGKDVILHQPMQASNLKMDPGPGAITKGMSQDQIRAIVRKNLAEVWPVVGINNHEGSLMTADRVAMNAVLDVVREKRIYFLDSRTDARTVAPELARERGMTIWERSVFLDNTQDRVSIIEAVNNGLKIADKKGTAIMIGHIWSNQLAGILSDMYPELVSQGFSLSTIAQVAMSEEFGE